MYVRCTKCEVVINLPTFNDVQLLCFLFLLTTKVLKIYKYEKNKVDAIGNGYLTHKTNLIYFKIC